MANSRGYIIALVAVAFTTGFNVVSAAQSGTLLDLQFCVYSQNAPRGIKFLPEPDEQPVELSFFGSQRSKSYSYRGPNPIVFFMEAEVPPDPARPNAPRVQHVPVGHVSIPSGMREAFVLFTPEGIWGPNTIPRYLVSIFDDSLRTLPKGHAVFLNATGVPFFGELDGRRIGVPTGLSQPFVIEEGETSVKLSATSDEGPISVFSDKVLLDPNQRLTIVLFPPYRNDSLWVQRRYLYDPDRPPMVKPPQDPNQ